MCFLSLSVFICFLHGIVPSKERNAYKKTYKFITTIFYTTYKITCPNCLSVTAGASNFIQHYKSVGLLFFFLLNNRTFDVQTSAGSEMSPAGVNTTSFGGALYEGEQRLQYPHLHHTHSPTQDKQEHYHYRQDQGQSNTSLSFRQGLLLTKRYERVILEVSHLRSYTCKFE